jgi:hypothetical protein
MRRLPFTQSRQAKGRAYTAERRVASSTPREKAKHSKDLVAYIEPFAKGEKDGK